MKSTLLIISLCIIGLFTNSCSKDDVNEGLIISSININSISCSPSGTQFIITNDSLYKNAFGNSTTCSLPAIDFNTYTLLGVYAKGGCNANFTRNVVRLDAEMRYHYKVTVKDHGMCKVLTYNYNWVTVPKLPNGWTVTFEVKNK